MLTPKDQQRLQQAYFDSFKNKNLPKAVKKKAKKQPESFLRDACKDLLKALGCFVWVNRTGMYSPRPGIKIPYGYKGSGDLLGCTPTGKFLCVETKYSTDQSSAQEQFQEAVERRNGIYILAYSVDDIEKRKEEILT